MPEWQDNSERNASAMFGGTTVFQLTSALLVYTCENREVMLTQHPIHNGPTGLPELGQGILASRSMLRSLVHTIMETQSTRQCFPENVLYAEPGYLLWWTPAGRRPIYFQTKSSFDQELSGETVFHPPLLFLAVPNGLWVWALDENKRPNETTEVCVAPYYNVGKTGSMCTGSVILPKDQAVGTTEDWENAFFQSHFTHTNLGGVDETTHPTGHHGFWREMKTADFGPNGDVSAVTKYLRKRTPALLVASILRGNVDPK